MNRRLPLAVAICGFGIFVLTICTHAQTAPLPIGYVSDPVALGACPNGAGWDNLDHMQCVAAVVRGCPGIQDASVTYGYAKNPNSYNGTIVLFHGWNGTTPATSASDVTFARDYYGAGYEVVMLAWDWDWELTTNPLPIDTPPYGNIQAAACRQATFLNYVFNSSALFSPGGGMCAQGHSAGSAAVAYSLAWYGASSYLDNVELTAGPVFSSIDQGCEVNPDPSPVTMCASGGTQGASCVGWPQNPPIQVSPRYNQGFEAGARAWTGISACANTQHQGTGAYNSTWNAMSIASSTATTQQFNYPHTTVAGWLCATTLNGIPMNNSSPQGQLFYQKLNGATPYTENAIFNCSTPEGVYQAGAITSTNLDGYTAIKQNMIAACHHNPH